MTKTISWDCPACKTYAQVPVQPGDLMCPQCGHKAGNLSPSYHFDTCACCPGKQFYINKDFNQALGCLIMAIGIILVPKTFGLSLPVMALIDWLMYRRLPFVAICYRCSAEYRGFELPKHFKPFLHHIGEKYDKYRG